MPSKILVSCNSQNESLQKVAKAVTETLRQAGLEATTPFNRAGKKRKEFDSLCQVTQTESEFGTTIRISYQDQGKPIPSDNKKLELKLKGDQVLNPQAGGDFDAPLASEWFIPET